MLVSGCSALPVLWLLLCFQPGRWLLPCGCPPPPRPLVFFDCVLLLGSPCALAAFVFPAWPLTAPFLVAAPPHPFVYNS